MVFYKEMGIFMVLFKEMGGILVFFKGKCDQINLDLLWFNPWSVYLFRGMVSV